MIGIWTSAGIWLDSACLWMLVLSTIDIALLLRFTDIGPGWLRFYGILVGSLIILLASQWLIAAHSVGLALGFFPFEAAQLIGPMLVWEFTRLRIENSDGSWLLISGFLMFWMSFRK